jgi:two-component system, chemotaxis family, sensor kinase CheA
MSEDLEMQAQFQAVFLDEAVTLLEDYEAGLLGLYDSEDKAATLAKIFRAIHSVKGSGASVGFTGLAAFAHANEDCLAALCLAPTKTSKELVSLLLSGVDILRSWMEGLKTEGAGAPAPKGAEDLRKIIKLATEKLVGGAQASISSGANAAPASSPESAKVADTAITAVKPVAVTAKAVGPIHGAKSGPSSKLAKSGAVVKIDSDRLDSLLDLIGELVVIKSQILAEEQIADSSNTRLNTLLGLLDKNVRDLYGQALGMRMMPVKGLMLKLDRAVRDAAHQVNKDVSFVVEGEDCELDRLLIEKIADPLMHLVRNAVDHGLENTTGRTTAGKPAQGTITITASSRGSSILFEIVDDGRGIDRNTIIQKAAEKGLIADVNAAANLSDADVYNFLFMSGFSTAAKVTELSGRGVGLDVVRSNVKALKGNVVITSTFGKGSKFSLQLPLTTAIADGLIVRIGTERYILPLDAVDEIFSLDAVSIVPMGKQGDSVSVHGKFFPLVNVANEFGLEGGPQEVLIIVNGGHGKYAIRIDEILGQSQVVQKPLHESLAAAQGISGTAILGDGRVALVLDTGALQPD